MSKRLHCRSAKTGYQRAVGKPAPQPDQLAAEIAACPICQRYGGGMMPPHTASPRCESGGRNHCTCDTCF